MPAAIHATLRNLESFADTVRYAVTLGGDTDTIAALAGALSGAVLGYSAIPNVWLDRLEAVDALTVLADELFAAANPGDAAGSR